MAHYPVLELITFFIGGKTSWLSEKLISYSTEGRTWKGMWEKGKFWGKGKVKLGTWACVGSAVNTNYFYLTEEGFLKAKKTLKLKIET